jgi:hypothetical protein
MAGAMGVPALHQVVAATERLAAIVLAAGPETTSCDRLVSDCLQVVYRVLFKQLAVRRGGVLTADDAVASLDLGVMDPGLLTGAVLAELESLLAFEGGDDSTTGPVSPWGSLHESVLARRPVLEDGRLSLRPSEPGVGTGRKSAGAYFTPPALVDWLLDRTLEPALDDASEAGDVVVCDPSCGAGIFLVSATKRLRTRGLSPQAALAAVVGVDRDAAALEIARACLWLEAVEPGSPVAMPRLALHCCDALLDSSWGRSAPPGGFHAVLGNPPFLTQLARLTAHAPGVAARLNDRSEGSLGPYTDVSAVFLQRSVGWVRPGGRIGLVQPQSVLAARDAAGVRAHVAAGCALDALWASDVPVFAARVLTCAPVLRKGAPQGAVRRFHGPDFVELAPHADPDLADGWSYLLAAGLGIPEVTLGHDAGVLSEIADCTADFRDQYYGLAPYIHEAGAAPGTATAPLVTSGLIDPAESLWGRRSTRFLKRSWHAPVIDLDALQGDVQLHRWASRRLVPKVLVGTQGKVIEAVVDEEGQWLPSVPTVTVVPAPELLWHVLAVLLAPPVAAHAAAAFAGTALSMRAIKLSAQQIGRLPLPVDRAGWDAGAAAVRRAQGEPARRREHLVEAGRQMCGAYGVGEESLAWWCSRLPG